MLVWKTSLAGLALVTLYSFTCSATSGEAMFGIEKVTAYPFSEFNAQVVDKNGNPVINAKVRRTYDWDGTLNEAVTYTDENGRFHFDSVSVQFRKVISQFSSSQRVFVEHDNDEFLIWGCGKIEHGEFEEFGGKPENMTCTLTHDYDTQKLDNSSLIATTCQWK